VVDVVVREVVGNVSSQRAGAHSDCERPRAQGKVHPLEENHEDDQRERPREHQSQPKIVYFH